MSRGGQLIAVVHLHGSYRAAAVGIETYRIFRYLRFPLGVKSYIRTHRGSKLPFVRVRTVGIPTDEIIPAFRRVCGSGNGIARTYGRVAYAAAAYGIKSYRKGFFIRRVWIIRVIFVTRRAVFIRAVLIRFIFHTLNHRVSKHAVFDGAGKENVFFSENFGVSGDFFAVDFESAARFVARRPGVLIELYPKIGFLSVFVLVIRAYVAVRFAF